jgi:prophage regulatory protein
MARKFLRLPAVLALTRGTRTFVYTNPNFPKPIKIGTRASAWDQDEIQQWMEDRVKLSRAA